MWQETTAVLIIALALGVPNIIMGYLRKYREKPFFIYASFEDETKKKVYLRLRGNFDIICGNVYVIAGLIYQILKPSPTIFILILSITLTFVLIGFHLIAKKDKVPYM